MKAWELRQAVQKVEVDYTTLINLLKDYASPRDKISRFVRDGVLLRIRKGLYVFSPEFAQQPYCLEYLANLIYGPSAISLEYALMLHGLIPEQVFEMTSVTFKRAKHYETPLGRFTYALIPQAYFTIGLTQRTDAHKRSYFIASPEKAIFDYIHVKKIKFEDASELHHFLFEDLRCDEDEISKLSVKILKELYAVSRAEYLPWLIELIKRKKK